MQVNYDKELDSQQLKQRRPWILEPNELIRRGLVAHQCQLLLQNFSQSQETEDSVCELDLLEDTTMQVNKDTDKSLVADILENLKSHG